MISFRTHVVTLVAVFLALAVGVVLGGGPLSELGRGTEDAEALRKDAAQARTEAAFGQSFADDVSATLLGSRLEDREVAVVTLPGVDSEVVEGLTERIGAAGGKVTVTQALGSSLVNEGEKSLVDTLGSQLMAQLPDGAVTAGASTYERAGELIGYSLASSGEKSVAATPQSTAVAEGLRGANLLDAADDPSGRAPLVLVVLGDEVTGEGADAILGGLLSGMATQARGLVVTAPTADEGEQLDRLREDEALGDAASVDGAETAAGQVAAIAALARSYDTQGGSFGAGGADGTVPLG